MVLTEGFTINQKCIAMTQMFVVVLSQHKQENKWAH
jgi:hypothetical protein